jgi:Ca2+-binding RTX toxin-like protein
MVYKVAVDSIGSDRRYVLGIDDILLVRADVAIISDDSDGILTAGRSSINVFGLVAARYNAISMDNANPNFITIEKLYIGSTGVLNSEGTCVAGSRILLDLVNFGEMRSNGGYLITLAGSGTTAPSGRIVNYGLMSGFAGIYADQGSLLKVFNYGTLSTLESTAISTGSGAAVIVNRGQIDGAIFLSIGEDQVTNRGTITGDVDLGAGSDVLDNRGGSIEGQIFLGTGADTIKPGASIETVFAGDDTDTLDFSKSTGVRVSLDDSIDATGWAKDDFYTGFEDLTGSATGNDVLVGDGQSNTIRALGGNDTLTGREGADNLFGGRGADTLDGGSDADMLYGGEGNDKLVGGLGADALAGELGKDLFVFAAPDLIGTGKGAGQFDTISDLSSADRDRIDLSAIDASTKAAKDQAFKFIGSAAFGSVAGQLRFEAASGGIFVLGDTNGDGLADFAIKVANVSSLTAADFVL